MKQALQIARDADKDVVEVAPTPPLQFAAISASSL